MGEGKIKEFVIRYIDRDFNDYLVSKGFFKVKRGTYENLEGTHRIESRDGDIKCISVERSSVYGEERVELQISFIPDIPVLEYLLKGIYFVR
jgi:hypothetical protein